MFDSIDNYQLAENKNQILTNPFFTVTFSRLRNNLKTESANKAVALIRGSDIESAVRVLIPENAEIIPCESYEDAVQLVISGQCGSTFMLTRSAEYMASLSEYNTLVSEYMPSMAMKLSVAVDSGCDPMFVSIISKATGSINESFVDSLRTKYTFKQQMDYSFRQFVREHPLAFFGVPAVILLLISLLLTRILYMRRRDHKVAAAVRALPLRYFVINDSGEILLCGLGVGSEAFKDKPTTIDNLPDPAVVDIMRDKIGDVLRNGCAETVNFEFAGQKSSAIVSPLPEATFGQNVAIWVSQDTTELQNSKAEAKRNEEFFRLTLDSIGDGVIATDSDGKVMLLNPVAERMTGVSEEDAIGKPHENIFNIIGMLDGQPTPSPIRRAIRTGMIIELANHTDLVSKTGKRYNIADSAAPICDEYGKIIGAILVFRDVTDDYRRRSELNDALANWETASEMANIATYRMDMETRRIAPGTNAGKYWPVKDGKAAEIKDWIYEEDQAEVAAVSEQIKNGEIDNATFGFRAVKDGNMCYYRQFLRKDPHNRGYVTGLIQDITEVTNRQQQQNAMMSLWQQTIDTVPIMLFIKDPADNFRYIQCNSKFADLPGFTKEEVAGKTDDEIFGRPIDAANFNQWDRDIMNGGVSKEFYETAQGGD